MNLAPFYKVQGSTGGPVLHVSLTSQVFPLLRDYNVNVPK